MDDLEVAKNIQNIEVNPPPDRINEKEIGYLVAVFTPLIALLVGLALMLGAAFIKMEADVRSQLLGTGNGLILGGGLGTGLARKNNG